tara:strand:+ start:88 stop:378 length:291 start_codon:yes stop_codon:yes gene_type:complete
MMAEQQIKNNDREEALDMITAAMSVIVQIMDLSMSADIIADAGEIYGRELVESLLFELTEASITMNMKTISKDIFRKRAILSMTRALPTTWMETRN